ncbi:MAG TPA: pantoate--beta-alanine ligase [Flavitalea sp.]|nr:pantoate--beta-alanine ligase [Flavitalea sp.]
MIIIHKPSFLIDYLGNRRNKGLTIGFVPTMGALHDAHIHLVNQSGSFCDITVCSIFVNPTQFNDPLDFDKYPVSLENDIRMLTASKATVLFAPSVSNIYPDGLSALEHYDLGYLDSLLEGEFRPGHFQGVCQVMSRLLKIVRPHKLFMGQKDYQQCMVIKKLLTWLNLDITFVTCSTDRENDGLAMSSRNMRLNPEQRSHAPLIYHTLTEIKNTLKPGDLSHLKHNAFEKLSNGGFRVEYAEISDAVTLHPVDEWNGYTPLVALVAAFLGDVRLIDNMLLNN